MYKGTIVENSLANKDILQNIKIEKCYQSDDWILYDVWVSEQQIPLLAESLADGPWYLHLWQSENDDVKVIFKNKIFDIKFSDKSTWHEAVAYGKSIGIPDGQLDFLIS